MLLAFIAGGNRKSMRGDLEKAYEPLPRHPTCRTPRGWRWGTRRSGRTYLRGTPFAGDAAGEAVFPSWRNPPSSKQHDFPHDATDMSSDSEDSTPAAARRDNPLDMVGLSLDLLVRVKLRGDRELEGRLHVRN